ncbi:hypothetical protein SASPL_120606 [Salvia splendens]|uniref:Uncharacterized protein n=1 Tax=Salvia splendens TaxID=180675 RepID=A0A8X8XTA8_SALSN|nr:hypothetical protein SASPL_120606 [Salvia splendens]
MRQMNQTFLVGGAQSSRPDPRLPPVIEETTDQKWDAKKPVAKRNVKASNEQEKCDKAQAASSSADLLGAASEYGKLDSTQGVGKYVDQAEGYPQIHPATAAEDKPVAETEIPSSGDVKKAEESCEVGDYAKKAWELLGGTGEKSGAEDPLCPYHNDVKNPEESGEDGDYAKKA